MFESLFNKSFGNFASKKPRAFQDFASCSNLGGSSHNANINMVKVANESNETEW